MTTISHAEIAFGLDGHSAEGQARSNSYSAGLWLKLFALQLFCGVAWLGLHQQPTPDVHCVDQVSLSNAQTWNAVAVFTVDYSDGDHVMRRD